MENGLNKIRQYEIRTIHDFLAIPEDRLDACLRDFKEWIAMGGAIKDLIQTADGTVKVEQLLPNLIWIDDGSVGLSQVSIKVAIKPAPTESEGGEV